MSVQALPQRMFTSDEFYAIDRIGVFDFDYGVELVEGRVVTHEPPSEEHSWTAEQLNFMLVTRISGTKFRVRPHSGLTISANCVLQPDFVVYKPREDRPRLNPLAEQVSLVIEVSHSSLRFDREAKAQLYAEANIPEYWVVDVVHKKVHVYTQPEDGIYSRMEKRSTDTCLTVCGHEIDIASIF